MYGFTQYDRNLVDTIWYIQYIRASKLHKHKLLYIRTSFLYGNLVAGRDVIYIQLQKCFWQFNGHQGSNEGRSQEQFRPGTL